MDLDTVRIEAGNFVCSFCNGAKTTDLLYSVKEKNGKRVYVFVHLEAQAKHDKKMALRIWEYHTAIARAHFNQGYEKLPLLYTIVLYNGKENWTSPETIADLFHDFDQYYRLSLKKPFLTNLQNIPPQILVLQEEAAAPQLIMKGRILGNYTIIQPFLFPLLKKYDQDDDENMVYIAINDNREFEELCEEFSKFALGNKKKIVMKFYNKVQEEAEKVIKKTRDKNIKEGIAQGIQQGIKQGKKEGIEKGIKQGKKQERISIIQQMFSSGMSKMQIAQILRLSLGKLETLLS
ncbi:MAG: Rpn family recombination-promoting nuclease/putative transposase [Bacteroidota bacterium]